MTKKLYPDLIPFVDNYIVHHKFFSIRTIIDAFFVTVKYEVRSNQLPNGNPSKQNKIIVGYIRAIERYFRSIKNKVIKYGKYMYQSTVFQDTK